MGRVGTRAIESTVAGTSSPSALAIDSNALRARGARAVQGTATPRPLYTVPGSGGSFNWYYPSLSSHLGFIGYYPYSSYGFYGRSSLWYNPYGYDPYFGLYGYDPFYYGYGPYRPYGYGYGGASGSSYGRDRDDRDLARMGSIRFRVNPAHAKVYVDGALAGTVDDFDGLTSHLRIEEGSHQIELRADGYQPYSAQIKVDAGKTRTERVSLKKN